MRETINNSPTSELGENWIRQSKSNSSPVTTSAFELGVPFQRWFKFKEAFSPQFIINCISKLNEIPETSLDPFGGSGTTALTSQFLGIHPTTIEVNPFLADLIEAKLTQYDTSSLKHDFYSVIEGQEGEKMEGLAMLATAPKTFVEPGVKERWIYSKESAAQILSIRQAIDNLDNDKNKRLLRVILGSILVKQSNVVVNGKGRRYRKNWISRQSCAEDICESFRGSFRDAFSDICIHADREQTEYTVIRGDSREMVERSKNVDIAILSPPYPNSFDYTDIYNVELWMLGYLQSQECNRSLRKSTLRSHVQIKRDFAKSPEGSSTLKETYARLGDRRPALWNQSIPEMVLSYFDDMTKILRDIQSRLNPNGMVFLAVGNSMYGDVVVDTETILKEIADQLDYNTIESEPVRSMRSSAQQGGRKELTESLISLA